GRCAVHLSGWRILSYFWAFAFVYCTWRKSSIPGTLPGKQANVASLDGFSTWRFARSDHFLWRLDLGDNEHGEFGIACSGGFDFRKPNSTHIRGETQGGSFPMDFEV